MTYGDVKGLFRRTASCKVLRDKAFNLAKNLRNDGYQGRIASLVHTFFDKKLSVKRARSETLAGANTLGSAVRRARSETLAARD